MEYRRLRQSRVSANVENDDFRASSNTPVRLLAEAGREREYDAQAHIIAELRREVAALQEREQRIVASYEKRLRDLEAVHKSDVAMLLEESKRLDRALLCIRGVCDFQQTTEREDSPCADELLAAVLSEAGFSSDAWECDEPTVVHNVGAASDRTPVLERIEGDTTDDGDVASASYSDVRASSESVSDGSVIFSRDDDGGNVKDSFCPIRDFRGENPGVVTENNMDRILDHPVTTYQGNTARRSHKFSGKEERLCPQSQVESQGQERSVSSPASAWKIPSMHTRTRLYKEIEDLEKKLRKRQQLVQDKEVPVGVDGAFDELEVRDEGADKVGVAFEHESEDDEFVRTIKALGDTSPTTANLLTQHVSDSWVQKYATKNSFASGGVSGEDSGRATKSSFLKRSPISLVEVFSSSTPLWRSRLASSFNDE